VTKPAGGDAPTLENLHLFKREPLKESRTPVTPDVWLLSSADGGKYVLKDFSRKALPVRVGWGRLVLGREAAAYQALAGVAGIPGLVSRPSADSLVMEWVDGKPLPRRKQSHILGDGFFTKLERLVHEMHERGIAHGDLRRRNILVNADGEPRILDFETCIRRDAGFPQAQFFATVCRIDLITITKIKAKYYPHALSEEEQRRLASAPWHLRLGRFIRQKIYGPLAGRKRKSAGRKSRRR